MKHESITDASVYGQRICEVEHASFTPIYNHVGGGWLVKPQFSTSISCSAFADLTFGDLYGHFYLENDYFCLVCRVKYSFKPFNSA